jgi:hypothetical protein
LASRIRTYLIGITEEDACHTWRKGCASVGYRIASQQHWKATGEVMTYPPGSTGYPPAQSPGSYGASTPPFASSDDEESNVQIYLTIAVVALGFASYLASFGPMITRMLPNGDEVVESGSSLSLPIDLALLAAVLAGVSLLPKAKNYAGAIAAVAVLGVLLLIEDTIGASGRGWELWFALGCGAVQAVVAAGVLLLDAGVINPPAPRPKYEQYGQYGQYGGYYGQQQAPYQQQSHPQHGYGSQYSGYPSSPSAGGFTTVGPQAGQQQVPQSGPRQGSAQNQQQGPPTPPTGFPSFSPPPGSTSQSAGEGNPGSQGGSGQGQQSYGQGHQSQTPSSPSGPSSQS